MNSKNGDLVDESYSLKLLLSAIDPNYPNNNQITDLAKKEYLISVIKLAKANGLYYHLIYRLKELNIDIPSSEEKHWNEELDALIKYKKTIEMIDQLSNRYDIDYILIKDCNTIPHIPRDIDIFIKSEDRVRYITALEDIGMKCTQSGIAETSLTGNYLKTDIYTEICYMGIDFIEGSYLLNSRIENEIFGTKYTGLNNESNFLLLLIHSLFGHRSMSLLDFQHLNNLYDKTDLNICRGYAIKQGWGRTFDIVLNKFNEIQRDLYNVNFIYFPYLFKKNFLLECLSGVEEFDDSISNQFFVHTTFIQDRLIYELKDSLLYNLVKSFEPSRNIINSLTASIKSRRGDRKSLDHHKGR